MKLRNLSSLWWAIEDATRRLAFAGIESSRHDAQRLVADALGIRWTDLWTRMDDVLDDAARGRVDELIRRRARGEPFAYIRGSTVFYGLELAVGPGVLVPRPETETLVDVAIEVTRDVDDPLIADIGCGSGAIGIALCTRMPRAHVWMTDISDDALKYARRNALAWHSNVSFGRGDLFDPLPDELLGRFDLIVSNPPYVPTGASLPADVRAEPGVALFAGADGCEVLRRIADEAPQWLKRGGAIALEIGESHQTSVLPGADVRDDATGRPRVVWKRL